MLVWKIVFGVYLLGMLVVYMIPSFSPKLYRAFWNHFEDPVATLIFGMLLWPFTFAFLSIYGEYYNESLMSFALDRLRGLDYYLPHEIVYRWTQRRFAKKERERLEREAKERQDQLNRQQHADKYL